MNARSIIRFGLGFWAVGCGPNNDSVDHPVLTYTREGACSSGEKVSDAVARAEITFDDSRQLEAWKSLGVIRDWTADGEGTDAQIKLPNENKKAIKLSSDFVMLNGDLPFRKAAYHLQANVSTSTNLDHIVFAALSAWVDVDLRFEDLRTGFTVEEEQVEGERRYAIRR